MYTGITIDNLGFSFVSIFGISGLEPDKIKETAPATKYGADYYYNLGDVALQKKDYKSAVDAFCKSLLLRPDDMDAKENYIYAKLMMKNQGDGGGGQDQNQDQNQRQSDALSLPHRSARSALLSHPPSAACDQSFPRYFPF